MLNLSINAELQLGMCVCWCKLPLTGRYDGPSKRS